MVSARNHRVSTRMGGAFAGVALALVLASCHPEGSQSSSVAEGSENPEIDFDWQGKTRHVVDGDSLYIGKVDTQIRLWGVDAPERDEAGYQVAKQKLIDLAYKKQIGCVTKDIDKYERIVARCFLMDGTEINKRLIKSGVTREYCRFTNGFYGEC